LFLIELLLEMKELLGLGLNELILFSETGTLLVIVV
jgi:hypothetical protein